MNQDDLRLQLTEALGRIVKLETLERDYLKVIAQLRDEVDALKSRLSALPSARPGAPDGAVDVAPLHEADATLRRLVQRIAMILQAEKIVIMFYDRESGELIGIPPAYGVDEDRLQYFRVRATQGISGQVFREGEPLILHDATADPRTVKDQMALLGAHNGVTVPLVIEKRDDENRLIERTTIGVLHAFNKRHGEDFNDEDVRLLERMARNVGSIIANLQLYREVVEEREELLQTFESLSAGLVLVSPEGRIAQMNASARAIFSAQQDSLGRGFAEVSRNQPLIELFETIASGQEAPGIEVAIPIGHHDRIYQSQGAQVRNEEGKDLGVVIILNDITEIKNIEKMKSSFVAMASHELRTPLTAIKGFTSTLLMDDSFSPDERREFLMIIDQECDRLRRLIDDLLNTARIEAGESLKPHYTTFSYKELLQKVVMIQRQATHKHQLSLRIEGDLPPTIIGDQDKLDQVLTNLLNNAIKYSPRGGEIIVHAKVDGDHILTGVQDHGLGIPADHVGRVFDKFHRVNNEDNRRIYGTGLGLFLVRHLVEGVHLGSIWCESEVDVGSTFWFRIPVHLDVDKATALND
jgi:two-component system phosphate regulon sensor histidine kinase PhoR